MENLIGIGGGLVVGLIIGFFLAKLTASKEAPAEVVDDAEKKWWQLREQLTGTQAKILQYMEARQESTIGELQEKFSVIPDRELHYRLEQIVLMGFMMRGRKDKDIIYRLNPEYSVTVEDDKTVFLSGQ